MPREPSRPVPLRPGSRRAASHGARDRANIAGLQGHRRRKAASQRRWIATLIAVPMAAFTVVFLWPAGPQSAALEMPQVDREQASFGLCGSGERVTCVVDGDTIWYRGENIRLADINTPETYEAMCDAEAALGHRATRRLIALLNKGAFTVAPNSDGSGRDTDTYGRSLRILTRAGASLGDTLVREGLAEEWRGYRREWC